MEATGRSIIQNNSKEHSAPTPRFTAEHSTYTERVLGMHLYSSLNGNNAGCDTWNYSKCQQFYILPNSYKEQAPNLRAWHGIHRDKNTTYPLYIMLKIQKKDELAASTKIGKKNPD